MSEIDTFVKQAREKGIDDADIRQTLVDQGWDPAAISVAMAGLNVPKPVAPTTAPTSTAANTPQHPSTPTRPTLSHLMAAVHHVILWFFTGASSIAIAATVASLYDMQVSTEMIASMIAVTLITFIPYAIFYSIYLRKNRDHAVIPGKVWSIITICLHSIGAMNAAIVAVVTGIIGGENATPVLTGALLVLLLQILVVVTYAFAAFGSDKILKLRKVILTLYLPVLIIMFGTLFTLSLMKFGPAKHDEALRKDLAAVVEKISTKTKEDQSLPENIDGLTSNSSISYRTLGSKKYEVCGVFQTGSSASGMTDSYTPSDAYVTDAQFLTKSSGRHCFTFESDYLLYNVQQSSEGAEILGL